MGLEIKCIINKPINSNCFVVFDKEKSNSCLIIDPGEEDCKSLVRFIKKTSLSPEFIILTHEHFDHIWGVNKLKVLYNPQLICSANCSKSIKNNKKNMSLFFNQIGFEVFSAIKTIEDLKFTINWDEHKIIFIETPGHTDGSICINIDNVLFTGDTIIKDTKTVTKLPSGDINKLRKSINLIFYIFKEKDIIVYSGHGDNCKLNEININKIL